MKSTKKLNEGCLKILKFLSLLYDDDAEYDKVLDIFKNNTKETPKENIQVTLNRYINTFKVRGIKIEKDNTKFKLKSSLYNLKLTHSDLKAISLITKYIDTVPENKWTKEVKDFLHNVNLRMNSDDKNTLNSLITSDEHDFSFYYSNTREQIMECEKICEEKFVINIIYLHNNKEQRCKGVLKELIYGSKTVSLKVYDIGTHAHLEIPINNILSIARLPQVANNMEMPTTVVYKLKNRLAKTYKLKENEYSDGYDENGWLTVINKDESFDKLLHRLLRYTYNCEIISPKNLRDEMIKLLNDTIDNYNVDEED